MLDYQLCSVADIKKCRQGLKWGAFRKPFLKTSPSPSPIWREVYGAFLKCTQQKQQKRTKIFIQKMKLNI